MASSSVFIGCLFYFFLTCSVIVDVTAALKCYVCGGESKLDCKNFESTQKFVEECKSTDQSCRSVKHGNKFIERSCESHQLNTCKEFNNDSKREQYCYCSNELCNGDIFPTDDEDLIEGSGKNIEKSITHNTIDNFESSAFSIACGFINISITFLLLTIF